MVERRVLFDGSDENPHIWKSYCYCFVYDPAHFIRNPAGLEELNRNEGELAVNVVVLPKH